MLWTLESVVVVFLPEQAAPAAHLSARETFPCRWCRWQAPWLRGDSYGTIEHIT